MFICYFVLILYHLWLPRITKLLSTDVNVTETVGKEDINQEKLKGTESI